MSRPTGTELLQGTDIDAVAALRDQILARAHEARTDIRKFAEFVMRTEHTRERVLVAPHQELFLDFVEKHPRSVCMLPIGHGKCHGKGTPILMADGSTKSAEEVRAGDRLMGPEGPKRVLSTMRGRGELFKVHPTKGSNPFVVNGDHILTLVHTETNEIIDISVCEYLQRSKWFRGTHKLFRVPVMRFDDEKTMPTRPYFLGVWFGDGLHSTNRQISVTTCDPEILAELVDVARTWELNLSIGADGISYSLVLPGGKSSGKGRERYAKNPLREHLAKHFGDELSMRTIRTAPWADRAEFLAGFIDADGYQRDNCIYISQKRKDWAEDVVFIARSLGASATMRPKEVPGYGIHWSICIYGDLTCLPMRVPRKKVVPRLQKKDASRTGFTIESIGEGDYFGFTLNGDGRYLLGDFTVTHNSWSLAVLTLFMLGKSPTTRGAIVSATEGQASKVVGMVRDYIESSLELRLVFPNLRRSSRRGDPWTMTELTVERPPGIRDASLTAYGFGGSISGARLNWIIADDLLDPENTHTEEARQKIYDWFDLAVLSRLDPRHAKVVVTNTPYHYQDVLHRLVAGPPEGPGWAMLRMDVEGNIYVQDDLERMMEGFEPYDHPLLVPASNAKDPISRLDAYKHLPPRERTLWPDRMTRREVELQRIAKLDHVFQRVYMCQCTNDATAMCKREYIETCKRLARDRGAHALLPRLPTEWFGRPCFTGVDLAWAKGQQNDECAMFTFVVHPDGKRQILDIDIGQYDPPTLKEKVRIKHELYGSAVRIENNGGQAFFVSDVLEMGLPVYAHNTSQTGKADWTYGVAAIFVEFNVGLWLIPNDKHGGMDPRVKRFVDACLNYVPEKHVADILMGSFLARAQAFDFGALTAGDVLEAAASMAGQIASDIGTR